METRPFLVRSNRPTAASLATALGGAYASYAALATLTAGFARAWSHGKASGWMEKIDDRRKALCYVVPLAGAFRVSLTVRPDERAALRADPALAEHHAALAAAKAHAEGHALRFDVHDGASFAPVARLLAAIVALRR